MKFIRTVLCLLAGAVSTLADTNLFSDGTWLIDGAADPGPNASSISIVIDKSPAGSFTELKFYYNTGGSNFAQVFSIKGNGTWQPALPPPSVPGGVFRLASYWDCEQGFIAPMTVTELGWKSKGSKKGTLELTGKMTNGNSMSADKMKITFQPTETDLVRVDLEFQLRATRDFCVNLNRDNIQDEFRAVTMYANFTNPNEYANDLARYIKITSKDCAGIYGCSTKREAFCISLTNAPAGYLVNAPRHLGDKRNVLYHTSELPRNTPSLAIAHFSPNQGRFKPQGVFTPTDDPAAENVQYFSNWVDAKKDYKTKQRVGKFKLSLEASSPKSPNCDALQEPASPAQ
ncbi:MAG: hypothetical protein WCS70_02300 [Verrucomicrobiota bacterium]